VRAPSPLQSHTAHQEAIKIGWCSKSISAAAAPYAIALQQGWFTSEGLNLDLIAMGSSSECAKQVAAGTLAFALPSVESAAVLHSQGVKLRYFYTAYQSNIYGMAVPADSAIQTVADLKGKRIGVVSPTSAGAVIARLLVREAKLDPDRDITLVMAGDPLQTAALLASGALDALSQFDTHYALVGRTGVPLRRLAHPSVDHFPSNGLLALEETLISNRREAVALGRGYAMGTIYATANPEGAIRALWATWPSTRPTDRDEATALKDGVAMLLARAPAWQLDRVGARLWGEHVDKHYQAYLDWLYANTFINEKVAAKDLVTSELLKEINAFDAAAVLTEALKEKP
jgi:NitT/TauT family transport system substrate-binding protein